MINSKPDEPNDSAVLLAVLADDFAVRLRSGEVPSIEEYAQKNALLADQIRELFPAMLVIEKSCLNLNSSTAPVSERVGAMIGRYKLLQRIGEGGFGIVFMAEQQQPVRRKVALKVLKPGVDTKQVIARFEAERQALAMMEHENIAKVLDAGETDSGRPYFVMELVHGIPITEYCDKNQLSPKQRLELFIQVCRAVQHAHTKGIIHRDIKPTNVLVTLHDGIPVPKVIDFGVAKATGQQPLTDQTLFTQFAQMVGTPLYMSPEQAELSGLDMDTRSDIYSLGVLLYELLTGTTPFDKERLRQAAHDEVRRIIREEEPPSPSTRISTLGNKLQMISADRKTEPKRLAPLVRGDLDWIVMKALEKDRKRRYETANGLATDVQRHLDNEPVMARPPSSLYRLQKLVARNKLAVTAVAGVVTALLLGITFSVWQAARANAALADLRAAAPDIASQGRALAANDRFDEAIEKFDYASRLRPDVAAYIVAKADLLQSQLQLREAAQAYRAALHLDPQQPQVQRNLALCEQLGAVNPGGGAGAGTLSHESINTIYIAMVQQTRPVAELMHVARLVGKERDHFLAYWTERLEKLPLPSGVLLKSRLTLRDDGLLALDLANSNVSDLSLLRDAPLGSLNLAVCRQVTQIEPLRGLPLRELSLSLTGVSDLTPLRDNRTLQTLILDGSKVTDISVLQGVPLRRLSLQMVKLRTLAPVARMALKELDLSGVSGADFSALAGLPLETLYLQFSAVSDLSFLRGVPLQKLSLGGNLQVRVRGLEVLRDIQTLETLILPQNSADLPLDEIAAIEALEDHPNLKEIRLFRELSGISKEKFWATWHRDHDWAFRLQKSGIRFGRSKSPDGTWILAIRNEPLKDLSILAGAPIGYLELDDDQLGDLTPLKGMPLRRLVLNNNPGVSDLTPLQDMPLEELHIYRTGVSDLTALKKMPLKTLTLSESASLRDLSPLAAISSLVSIMLPTQVTDLEPLRHLPNLQWIGFGTSRNLGLPTTETFWKSWDGLPWARKLEAAGVKFRLEQRPDGTLEVWVSRDPSFSDCSIFERSNVRQLSIDGTSVKDLRPLMELPLELLSIKETAVSDLSPLRSPVLRKSLIDFWAWKTPIADFTPLTECTNLQTLDLGYTGLGDLKVLRGLKLQKLWIAGLPEITDISSLVDMPLQHIDLTATPVRDISPLLECHTLRGIILPAGVRNVGVLRGLPNLERLSYMGDIFGLASQTTAEFWSTWTDDSWLTGLRDQGLAVKSQHLPNGTWDITLDDQRITDLTVLRGAPISRLSLMQTEVSDLSPLRYMRLTLLSIANTKITDLRALEEMPLQVLVLSGTSVSDLTPIRRAKLTHLYMTNCKLITDLSPLREMVTLKQLDLPPNARDIEFLRAMPNIAYISFRYDSAKQRPSQTAAEFWAEYDLKKAAAATQPTAPGPARIP